MISGQTTHAKYSHTSKRQIQPYNQQITHKQFQKRLETRTLTSRIWKRANGASTRDLGVHQPKDGSQNWQDSEKEPGKLSQQRLLTENMKQDSEKGIGTAGRDTYME